MNLEQRIKRLEDSAANQLGCRETIVSWPGGEYTHRDGDGPVIARMAITCVSQEGAELVRRVLNGERT